MFIRTCWRTHQSVTRTACPCRWHWLSWRPWQRSLTKKRGKPTNDVRSVTSQRPWTSATLTRFASVSDWFIARWAHSYRLTVHQQMLIRLSGHQFPLACCYLCICLHSIETCLPQSGWAVSTADISPPSSVSKCLTVCSISFWVTAAATWSVQMTWSRPSTATVGKSLKLRSDAFSCSTTFSCVPHPMSGKGNKADLFSSDLHLLQYQVLHSFILCCSLLDSNNSYFTFCMEISTYLHVELNRRKWRWKEKTLCITGVLEETFDHRDILGLVRTSFTHCGLLLRTG